MDTVQSDTIAYKIFYSRMGLLLIALLIAGFMPFIFKRFDSGGTMSPVMVVHAIVHFSWYILFVYQASLIAKGNRTLHMKLGKASLYMAVTMTILSFLMLKDAFTRGTNGGTPFSPEHFLILPFWGMVLFAVFYFLGYRNRKDAITHKHYMLLAGILIMDPATARIGISLGFMPLGPILLIGLVSMVAWYDKKKLGAVHKATKVGFAFLFVFLASIALVGPTEPWAKFMHLLLG